MRVPPNTFIWFENKLTKLCLQKNREPVQPKLHLSIRVNTKQSPNCHLKWNKPRIKISWMSEAIQQKQPYEYLTLKQNYSPCSDQLSTFEFQYMKDIKNWLQLLFWSKGQYLFLSFGSTSNSLRGAENNPIYRRRSTRANPKKLVKDTGAV